jgi:acetyltransferase-like isoleucine patch superfamily enzyme
MPHKLERLSELFGLAIGRTRARVFALRGASIGPKALLASGCRVARPGCLQIGERFVAEEWVYMKIVADSASLVFGSHVFVGRGTEFDVIECVRIGDHVVIAPGCFITDHNHGTAPEIRIDQQPCVSRPVTIGSDVWLGTGVVVLPGVTIGDGAVVGAKSVVNRNVPPMAVVAGNPAKLIRYRDNHESK